MDEDDTTGKNTAGGKLRRALLRYAQQKALGALAAAERDIFAHVRSLR